MPEMRSYWPEFMVGIISLAIICWDAEEKEEKKNSKTIFTMQVYSRFHGKIGFTVCKLRVSAEGFHALLLKHLQMQNFMIYSYFKTSHAQEAKQKPYVNQNNKHNE